MLGVIILKREPLWTREETGRNKLEDKEGYHHPCPRYRKRRRSHMWNVRNEPRERLFTPSHRPPTPALPPLPTPPHPWQQRKTWKCALGSIVPYRMWKLSTYHRLILVNCISLPLCPSYMVSYTNIFSLSVLQFVSIHCYFFVPPGQSTNDLTWLD